eukprot:2715953-Pyramimonas_sp.AAC.1
MRDIKSKLDVARMETQLLEALTDFVLLGALTQHGSKYCVIVDKSEEDSIANASGHVADETSKSTAGDQCDSSYFEAL